MALSVFTSVDYDNFSIADFDTEIYQSNDYLKNVYEENPRRGCKDNIRKCGALAKPRKDSKRRKRRFHAFLVRQGSKDPRGQRCGGKQIHQNDSNALPRRDPCRQFFQ